ncbi:protein Star [Procambarus clarkii]|uniref:protein Star n=1 Tax=Procambarus clarkii TaxID=6728 RepID=UPI003744413B
MDRAVQCLKSLMLRAFRTKYEIKKLKALKRSLYRLVQMKTGVFVEVGALDGEYLSNSLYLERHLGWSGLLIEPYPVSYKQLLSKHRKAYSVNAALSVTNVSSNVMLRPDGDLGVLSQLAEDGVPVKAFPLYTFLLALQVSVVDFFSLDVEGVEVKTTRRYILLVFILTFHFQVLKTIPWDKVKFRLLCIEVNHIPEGQEALRVFMESKGYKHLGLRDVDSWFGFPELLAQTAAGN